MNGGGEILTDAGMTAAGVTEGRVEVTHPIGLHARPSVKLTKLAKGFESTVRLRTHEAGNWEGGDWVDAKSIVRVMAMKVKVGQSLEFRAEGSDAAAAVAALTALVRRNFGEQDGG